MINAGLTIKANGPGAFDLYRVHSSLGTSKKDSNLTITVKETAQVKELLAQRHTASGNKRKQTKGQTQTHMG